MDSKNQIEVWLKKLEQESWQLELLVSGFTIFLLQSAYQAITDYSEYFSFHHEDESTFFIIANLLLYILSTCILVLMINLVLHLSFRGFWIGAIGLRSVGANIDYDKLRYTAFFTRKLKASVVSMDDLIVNLDRVCSVVFSFTFLIIFLFLSLFVFLFIITSIQFGLQFLAENSPLWAGSIVQVIASVITLGLLIAGLLYLVDSLSLGLLKKSRRIRPLYFPIYKFLSTITLSFLYRTIYYNIITKFPLKYTRIILVFYLLIILFIPFVSLDDYRYFPDNETEQFISSNQYDDKRGNDRYIMEASIPSMVITENLIPLFVRYRASDNSALAVHCPEFEPSKSGGIKHGIRLTEGGLILSTPSIEEKQPEKVLGCLKDFYALQIDHEMTLVDRVFFYTHPNQQEKGIMIMINTEELAMGPHEIKLSKQILQDSVLEIKEYANIQFWKQ